MKNRLLFWTGIVLKAVGISILIMWSFFDFSPVSFGTLLFVPGYIVYEKRRRRAEEDRQLTLAFKDALFYLRNAITAGYSPENGMKETLKCLEHMYHKEHRICREFKRMISQMEVGFCLEEVWQVFGEHSGVEDIRRFAEILSTIKRTGGEMGHVLRQTGEILQDKIELKRELRAVVAAKEAEFRIMCLLPYAILCYLKLFAPSMSALLYHNTVGVLFMWGVLLCHFGFCLLGEKIIQKELVG